MKAKAKIEFEFDADLMYEDLRQEFDSDPIKFEQELIQYAIDTMVDDIYTMVKYGEVSSAIRVEIER